MFKVVPILLCVLMRCSQSDGKMSLLTQVPDIISQLCPGSNVCSSNRSSKTSDEILFEPGTESCCAECSCFDNCTQTGNCCFPEELSSEMKYEENDNSYHRSCLYPIIPQPTLKEYLYQSFLMVSSVMRTGTVGESNLTCGDMNVAPLGNFHPVYSAKSKQIYKNIECAKEDNEDSTPDDFIFWDAYANCKDETIDQGINLLVNGLNRNSIPESCSIEFVFPGDSEVLHPLKCFTNLIDTCTGSRDFNVPGGINIISKDDIRTLCTDSGIVSPFRAGKMYVNVFCHICSGEIFSRGAVCKTRGGFNDKGGKGGGFVALIDNKFITEQRDTSKMKTKVLPIACSIKEEGLCRPIFCPTGKIRDSTSKCVYPNKLWYNQLYTVFVNLTLYKPINISEVFNITTNILYSLSLPLLKSPWLKRWNIETVYFREMDQPYMSNNIVISVQRQLSQVRPHTFITNIKKMVEQTWTLRFDNGSEIQMNSNFSTRTMLWLDKFENKRFNFYNLTDDVETPIYKQAYNNGVNIARNYHITKLYICDQIELEPSEFLLSNEKNCIYSITTKRFLFDSQFMLLHSPTNGQYRARICIGDSGLYRRTTIKNCGAMRTKYGHCFVGAFLLLTHLYQSFS